MEDKVERMSIMEHSRWNWQKILQGWVHKAGSKKDPTSKTHPDLVPWKGLTNEIQERVPR
ncbi:MAG: hypothetical protein HYU43_08085, partial [Armatimonadetes bacterium]|nr:hypothetical protein [Armatimonadota bacterium]